MFIVFKTHANSNAVYLELLSHNNNHNSNINHNKAFLVIFSSYTLESWHSYTPTTTYNSMLPPPDSSIIILFRVIIGGTGVSQRRATPSQYDWLYVIKFRREGATGREARSWAAGSCTLNATWEKICSFAVFNCPLSDRAWYQSGPMETTLGINTSKTWKSFTQGRGKCQI